MVHSSKTTYNTIGKEYSRHRRPDTRIVDTICEFLGLPPGSRIADIGAGTGNYARALAERGYRVTAVEPSHVMREQAEMASDKVHWLHGFAEQIPLQNNSVHGVICVLASHHFKSLGDAFAEMGRICGRGPIVVFTFDARQAEPFWFAEYWPQIWNKTLDIFPPLQTVTELFLYKTGRIVRSEAFALPDDLADNFMAAGWRRPEMYFDSTVRACMSGFALEDQTVVESGLKRLKQDLDTGAWVAKHGHLMPRKSFDAGYRFLVAEKQ